MVRQHQTPMRNCASGNLEILRCAIAHRSSMRSLSSCRASRGPVGIAPERLMIEVRDHHRNKKAPARTGASLADQEHLLQRPEPVVHVLVNLVLGETVALL